MNAFKFGCGIILWVALFVAETRAACSKDEVKVEFTLLFGY